MDGMPPAKLFPNPYIQSALDRVKRTEPLTPATVLLRQFLIDKQMTVPELSRRTGFKPNTLYQFICGRPGHYPTLCQAYAVEYATEGKVPAYLWLDNPHVAARVRQAQTMGAVKFETNVKHFALKFASLATSEGMLRDKARILARLFKVEWGEVKRRCWEDGRAAAKRQRANVDHLLKMPITDEEHNAQNEE